MPATGVIFSFTPNSSWSTLPSTKTGIEISTSVEMSTTLSMNLPFFRAEKMPATIPITASMANEVSPSLRVRGTLGDDLGDGTSGYVLPRSPVKTPLM